ncbi:MAG: hypothetical protein H5T74_09095 [Actinobacteria bacterium]|nr:hypothetical protein [Actinomycetota bacterium]
MKVNKRPLLFVLVLAAALLIPPLSSIGPALAQGGWSLEATGGLGSPANVGAASSAVYNSKLYVGTENSATGLQIFSYDGENWTQEVGGGPGHAAGGFGDPNNLSAASMIVYRGQLYVGTFNGTTGCEIWRHDGTAWEAVVGGGAAVPSGFGSPGNLSASAMATYGLDLYVGTYSWGGCEVWAFDGANWTQTVGASPTALIGPGFGTACVVIESMQVFGTGLYAGTGSPGGCEVWAFDGAGWTPQVSADPSAPLGAGFGDANNADVMDMAVYEGSLYAGTSNWNTGCEVWAFDGANWSQAVGDQPGPHPRSGFGYAGSFMATQLEVYDSRLYVGIHNGSGCMVAYYDGFIWMLEVGGGAPGTYTARGFGDPNNIYIGCASIFNNRLFLGTSNNSTGCDLFALKSSTTWYLAEGATAGGFETWVLVQNPNAVATNVTLTFQTESGPVAGPTDVVPANSRRSYLLNNYVTSFDVSTKVAAHVDVICERAVYWTPPGSSVRRVGHDSIGVVNPASTWYLPEGVTRGGWETWVLIQNPNPNPVNVDVVFQTGTGEVQGPQQTLAANSRKSYKVDDWVDTYDVSTQVTSYMGDVVCERAVYYTPEGYATREVGHDSIGVVSPSTTWYLSEGATAGGFETWVLVQNPNLDFVNIDMKFQTGTGQVQGPVESIPARSRKSYRVDDWVDTFDVSTMVTSTGGAVVCERAMYESPASRGVRLVGHDSIGATVGGREWYLPEGATASGFETWVLVQNPNPHPVDIAITFQTGSGEMPGPAETIPARSRRSYEVSRWAVTNDVSTKVTSTAGGYIICERAVYWRPFPGAVRYLGTDSIGYDP